MTSRSLFALVLAISAGAARADVALDRATACGTAAAALAATDARSPLATGSGVTAAIADGGIAWIGAPGRRATFAPVRPGKALLRHAAPGPGRGFAYVEDERGDDTLVVVRETGTETIRDGGEILHPTWSPAGDLAWSADGDRLVVWSAGRRRATVAKPRGTVGVAWPAFTGRDTLVAVVTEPAGLPTDEEEARSNLWRHDLASGRWEALTAFAGDAENWSVVRTPVVERDGTIHFVRIHGRASATVMPTFELWQLRGPRRKRVRELAPETYLAGMRGTQRVWNRWDQHLGVWKLTLEHGNGSLEEVGCGAVAVDPRGVVDPDLARPEATAAVAVPDPDAQRALVHATAAVKVGDFDSEPEATAAAARLAPAAEVRTVHHETAPLAVRPGSWAVVLRIQEEPTTDLAALRTRFPEWTDRTWIVPYRW